MKKKKPSPNVYDQKIKVAKYDKFSQGGSVHKKKINPLIMTNSVREDSLTYKDLPSKVTPGFSTNKKDVIFYTGDKVKGISLVHKSGFMPVFTDEQAKDFANMRR